MVGISLSTQKSLHLPRRFIQINGTSQSKLCDACKPFGLLGRFCSGAHPFGIAHYRLGHH